MRSLLLERIWITLTCLSVITTAVILLSCTSVPVKDQILYGNEGMAGAIQFHTLVSGKKDLSFEDWMKVIREQPMICIGKDDFAADKAIEEKLCSICNCCSYDTTKEVDTLFNTVQSIQIKKGETK